MAATKNMRIQIERKIAFIFVLNQLDQGKRAK